MYTEERGQCNLLSCQSALWLFCKESHLQFVRKTFSGFFIYLYNLLLSRECSKAEALQSILSLYIELNWIHSYTLSLQYCLMLAPNYFKCAPSLNQCISFTSPEIIQVKICYRETDRQQTDRQTNSLTPYIGVCGFFQVKSATPC